MKTPTRFWIKRIVVGALGATVLLGSLAAWSQRGPDGDSSHFGMHHGMMSEEDISKMRARMLDRIATQLDLDTAQKARLSTLADKLHAQRMVMMGGAAATGTDPHAAMKARLQALVAGNTFDRSAAQAMIDEKLSAIRSSSPEMINAFGDFYDSLRPEQQQKLRDTMAKGPHGFMQGFMPH